MRITAYSKRKRSRKSAKIRPIRVICDPIPPLKISRAETQGRRGFFIDGVELLFMSSPLYIDLVNRYAIYQARGERSRTIALPTN
jgi:hypothetical protein